MKSIKVIIAYIYFFLFGRFSTRTVEKVKEVEQDTSQMFVVSIKGFITTFYCKRIKFVVKHNLWFLPDLYFKIYKLYATTTDDAPDKLKNALQEPCYLPNFNICSVNEFDRRKMLIQAYIDILIKNME